jgi:hypothetical protein
LVIIYKNQWLHTIINNYFANVQSNLAKSQIREIIFQNKYFREEKVKLSKIKWWIDESKWKINKTKWKLGKIKQKTDKAKNK